MREIKFKAWCKAKKKLYEVYSISKYEVVVYDTSNQKEYLCEDCELMQYAGLKDKDSIKVYEGDIVRWNRSRGVDDVVDIVVYDKDFLSYRIGKNGIFFKPQLNNNIEVIGNIYENPELLEQKWK